MGHSGPPGRGCAEAVVGSGSRRAASAESVGRLLSVNVGMPKDVSWQGRTVFTGVFKEPVSGRAPRPQAEHRRRRPGRSGGTRRRAAGGLRLPDRVVSLLGRESSNGTTSCTASSARTSPWRACRRRGVHRRPLPDRHRVLRGHPAASDLLPGRDPHGRPADTRAAGLPPPPRLLLPGDRGGRGRGGRRDPQARHRPRADARRRSRRRCSISPGTGARSCSGRCGSRPSARAGRTRSGRCSTKSPGVATPALPRRALRPHGRVPAAHCHGDHARERLGDLDPSRGPRRAPLPPALPGQYLTLRVQPDEGRERSLLRNYSLSGPPGAAYYRVSVKREPQGAASGYLPTRLSVGDELDVAAPRGTFILDATDAPVLLVSAGIGATPVLAMLQALAQARSAARGLVAAQRAQRSRAPVRGRGTRAPRLAPERAAARLLHAARPGGRRGRGLRRRGRLTGAALAALEPPVDAQAYLCGPAPFMDEISAGLAEPRDRGLPHPHRALRARSEPDARYRADAWRGRPIHRRASPGAGPRSSSRAVTSRSRGAGTTEACSNSPRPATFRCAGRAGPACVRRVRRRSSRGA